VIDNSWLQHKRGGFKLHSGDVSPFLIDAHQFYLAPEVRRSIISYWIARLNQIFIHVPESLQYPHIYGIPTGGTEWARALEEALAERAIMTPFTLKDILRIKPNTAFIVDDVVTTGASIFQHDLELQSHGIHPVHLAVVIRGDNLMKHEDANIIHWMKVRL